jgi:hypothetical protein
MSFTQDEIIEMARQAGFTVGYGSPALLKHEAFAKLLAAKDLEAWQQEREQLLTQIGVLRSQLLGVRMEFGEGSTISNLAAALDAESAINTAAILARSNA